MIRAKRYRRRLLGVLVAAAAAMAAFGWSVGLFDRDPDQLFGAGEGRPTYVAVLFSGDMGLHYGMTSYITAALNRKGVPVLGVSSPAEFATRKSRTEVDTFVADAVQAALRRTGASKVLLMGQSFGADIARVGLASLAPDLRPKVAAAVLVVPGTHAFFRADPSSLSYHGTPDAGPAEARAIDWLPVLCIQGSRERDSLCPVLAQPNVRTIVLPGGHFLQRDHVRLTDTIVAALEPMLGGSWR